MSNPSIVTKLAECNSHSTNFFDKFNTSPNNKHEELRFFTLLPQNTLWSKFNLMHILHKFSDNKFTIVGEHSHKIIHIIIHVL